MRYVPIRILLLNALCRRKTQYYRRSPSMNGRTTAFPCSRRLSGIESEGKRTSPIPPGPIVRESQLAVPLLLDDSRKLAVDDGQQLIHRAFRFGFALWEDAWSAAIPKVRRDVSAECVPSCHEWGLPVGEPGCQSDCPQESPRARGNRALVARARRARGHHRRVAMWRARGLPTATCEF